MSVSSLSTLSSLSTHPAGPALRGGANMGGLDKQQVATGIIVASGLNALFAAWRMYRDESSNDDVVAWAGGSRWWQIDAQVAIVVAAVLYYSPPKNDLLRTLVVATLAFSGFNAGYTAYRMGVDKENGPSDAIAHLPYRWVRILAYVVVTVSALLSTNYMLSDPKRK